MACNYLTDHGFLILQKNYRNKCGEIDLIGIDEASDEKYLCFIEVKYRVNNHSGDPLEAVDYRKAGKICRTAAYYMMSHNLNDSKPIRFDVVAILDKEIKLIKNAFEYIY